MDSYALINGVVAAPESLHKNGGIAVDKGKITSVKKARGSVLDLGSSSCIYPALINIHDHLRGNYLPRVGPKAGNFYLNWLPWDNDLKASDTYVERSNLSFEDIYMLSAYKNLFSGVITVNDHFPHNMNKEFLSILPVRAFNEYTLEHECSSYDLNWGDGIEIEHERAKKNNWPFITHLEEGFDPESMDGVNILERLGCLDDYCVLIHCIGFSDEDIDKVAQAGASVAWCPASNKFMFNVTCKVRKMLEAGVNIAIGTDSTHTGSINLLAEMQYARTVYREMYGEDISARTLHDMISINAAKAFRLQDRIGSLDDGKLADILVLKRNTEDYYENLAEASMSDIELLIMEGRPVYGELRFLDLLDGQVPRGYSLIQVGARPMFVVGDPQALYKEVRRKVGFKKVLDYLPFEPAV